MAWRSIGLCKVMYPLRGRMATELWAPCPCKEQKATWLPGTRRDGPCQTATVPCPLQLKRLLAPSTPIRMAPGLGSNLSPPFFPFPLFLLLPASSLVGPVTLSLRLGPPSDLHFSLPIYRSFIGINSLAQTGDYDARLFDETRPARLPAPFVRTRALVPIRQSCIFSTLV